MDKPNILLTQTMMRINKKAAIISDFFFIIYNKK